MSGEKIHLFDLRLRTSAAGNEYLSGWLGKAAVVGFRDREAEGEVWNVFVSAPTPRPAGSTPTADRSPFTPSSRPRNSRRPRQPIPPGVLDDDLADI